MKQSFDKICAKTALESLPACLFPGEVHPYIDVGVFGIDLPQAVTSNCQRLHCRAGSNLQRRGLTSSSNTPSREMTR